MQFVCIPIGPFRTLPSEGNGKLVDAHPSRIPPANQMKCRGGPANGGHPGRRGSLSAG